MFKLIKRPTGEHTPRKAGERRVVGVAGKPLKLRRYGDKAASGKHAVRPRPALHERLATRVKRETKRLEPPKDFNLGRSLSTSWRQLREAILPNDPRDIEIRRQSGEAVIALVGAVDLVLLLAVSVLLVIGTVMVYSAGMVRAVDYTGSTSYYLIRQTEGLLLGGVGMYLAMRLDYRRWRVLAGIGLVVSIPLLLLVLRSHAVLGARRWIDISFLRLQPSEVAKLALVLYAAHWFSSQRPGLRHSLRGLLPFGLVVAVVAGLVLVEPDLGTTVVIVVSLATVYFVAGARGRHLGLLALVAVIGVKIYLGHLHGYQYQRLQAFLHPSVDPMGASYHILQAQYALGSGGLTGVGLGNGQAKYAALPEPNTDSIFAILGEEWGLVGTLGLLLVFALFAVRGMRASMLAPDLFGRLLAAGITCSIVFQALLNMAVVADVVPFTGVPLPFISYGNSSLSISMIAAGVLLNISKQAVDLREGQKPASTYLWWRNRRPHLPIAGRGEPTDARAAVGRQRSAITRRRPADGSRRPAGR